MPGRSLGEGVWRAEGVGGIKAVSRPAQIGGGASEAVPHGAYGLPCRPVAALAVACGQCCFGSLFSSMSKSICQYCN
eukprot:660380-Alexandrium_andersonii.AAC.1